MEFNQSFFLTTAAVVCAVAIVVMLYSFIRSYFFKNKEVEVTPESVPSNNDLPSEDVGLVTTPVAVTAPVTITITSPSSVETEVVRVSSPEVVVSAPAASNDVVVFKIENAKPKEDKWGVKNDSATVSTHKTQHQAEKAAVDIAKQTKASVVIFGRSGELRKKMTYSK